MKHILPFLILSVFCMVSGVPAFAQDAAVSEAAKAPQNDADLKERLALAGKMHEIWPIRTRVEDALEGIAVQLDEDKQAQFKAEMRKSIKFDELEEESIKAMAETFTAEELNAMIAFYGSPTGRAISAKTADYEAALRPIMVKMLDQSVMKLRTGAAP